MGNLKEININSCTYYSFDDIIKIEDFDSDNNLLEEKSYENILVYNISYKNLIGAKPLHIRFDEVDGFIRAYDGNSYLVLFGPEKYVIHNRIRYLISKKGFINAIRFFS